MIETTIGYQLLIWQQIALAIASQHLSHKQRKSRIDALEIMIDYAFYGSVDEAWVKAETGLRHILLVAQDEKYSHSQHKALLRLFALMCEHLAKSPVTSDVNDIPF